MEARMNNRNRSLNSLEDIEFAVKRIEELEAKRAVAVTHFKKLRRRQYSIETFDAVVNEIVEAALAELTGGKDE